MDAMMNQILVDAEVKEEAERILRDGLDGSLLSSSPKPQATLELALLESRLAHMKRLDLERRLLEDFTELENAVRARRQLLRGDA